ncbi:NAD(P)H-binding protein [Vibrio fluvialis]|uniref:NAD(P)H-binding protein n=1 Tax=Vibrio fluvialis TaxID=676 RepID=UPI001C9D2AFA|nr:NAD(P)H-binding protein [Vibrio fluvialis]EKO3429182.1 NAD(P)H-binding protein [Vibrio fluvialis]EKO3432719.1 NAD(P)H-binding protein [Vibrio fluvialis]EKO3446582.1 NAD(P)H-binding protein [Vibrio fluvialis]EKO3945752.1 NAD(P)H-binding protein [Vibrio fluvialis]ELF6479472.1 NAD(P)H-binding protein [Vibrio fluvialis]
MKHIAIIGAGWLGLPLAKHLQSLGYQVSASRTSQQGVDELKQHDIDSFICDLSQSDHFADTLASLHCDTVVGSFPPGFRRGQGAEYATQWQQLVNAAKAAHCKKVVMVSSTTVYPDRAETMDETKATLALALSQPDFSANAKVMLQAEQSVIDSGLEYAIVRCSGLIGPSRHPARFAARLKQVSTLAPANMLHQADAVGAVAFAVEHFDHDVVNATTPHTVSKAEFYQAALQAVSSDEALPPVVEIADKLIVSDKLAKAGYQFHYSHTLEALNGDE